MADIKVSLVSDDNEEYTYDVEVNEGGSATEHRIVLTFEDYEALEEVYTDPEELIKKSFEFLLEREPKESILGEFNLMDIGKNFPEYQEEVLETK